MYTSQQSGATAAFLAVGSFGERDWECMSQLLAFSMKGGKNELRRAHPLRDRRIARFAARAFS